MAGRRDLLELASLAASATLIGLDLALHLAILYVQLRAKLLAWRVLNKAKLRWALVKSRVPRSLRRELAREYDETLSAVRLPGLRDAIQGWLSPWSVHSRPRPKRSGRAG